MKNVPPNLRSLQDRLRNVARDTGEAETRLRTTVALVVVGQMLPEGVVKGGSAMALRCGRNTRFTKDFDAARISPLEDFRAEFEESLEIGWEGFTGRLIEKAPPTPVGVPSGYVMQPFEVKLSYRGKSWCTVDFELGHNEIDDASDPEKRISDELVGLFTELGLSAPAPVPVMRIDHQIAQKIHAVSAAGSDRARDLVDLQILVKQENVDYRIVSGTCRRLFEYRKAHEWPPAVTVGDNWVSLYDKEREGLDVLGSVEDAVAWLNDVIQKIERSSTGSTL